METTDSEDVERDVPEPLVVVQADPYVRHFEEARKKVDSWRRVTWVLVALLTLGICALLYLLHSQWLVVAYVLVLLFIAGWGAFRLQAVLAVLEESLEHSRKFALRLRDKPSRDEYLSFIRTEITPNDNSNVPEAMEQLAAGTSVGDTVHLAARYAFQTPMTELGFANFVRGVLVLAGLFGTVLFFALELSETTFIGGDLGPLLSGLRGALASTLTGLSGSVLISFIASNIVRHVDTVTAEFEAFLSALVVPLFKQRRKITVRSEQDLWESLRQEVEDMATGTTQAYEKMSTDAALHVDALDRISRRLDSLPQVQWPENFDQLRASLETFSHSAQVLAQIVPRLIETASSLQVYAPAKMLRDIEHLDGAVRAQQEDLRQASVKVQQLSATVTERAAKMEEVAGRISSAASSVVAEHAATNTRLEALKAEVEQSHASSQQTDASLRQTRAEIEAVKHDIHQLRGTQLLLQKVNERLGEVNSLLTWHERASRAPLMQALLSPLWKGWFGRSSPS